MVVASQMVSPPTIPGSGKEDARTWVHSDFRHLEFKALRDSGADAVREVVRSTLQKILEEEFGMGTFVAQRKWLAEVKTRRRDSLKRHSEVRDEHGSE